MATEKKELKTIPGFSRGVRANAAVRMMKLGRPVCPNSKVEMERIDGRYVPKPPTPGRENCQLRGGHWWEACEELGHNPYFTTRTWYTEQDVITEKVDAEGNKTGIFVKTGTDLIPHSETIPNIAQVAIGVRYNSDQGVVNAINKKGFKRLGDIGFYEVCQFRNCQSPVSTKAKSRKFGHYCSVEHLQLICADQQGELLHIPDVSLNGVEHGKIVRMREKQLREASMGAFDA
jgi:hypothetical protein